MVVVRVRVADENVTEGVLGVVGYVWGRTIRRCIGDAYVTSELRRIAMR